MIFYILNIHNYTAIIFYIYFKCDGLHMQFTVWTSVPYVKCYESYSVLKFAVYCVLIT